MQLRETKQLEAAEGEQQKGDAFSAAEEHAAEESTTTKQLSCSPNSGGNENDGEYADTQLTNPPPHLRCFRCVAIA